MKKNILIILLAVLSLSGCASLLPPSSSSTVVVDYSWLTEQGFFITESNSVSFPYKAVASVAMEEIGGFRKLSKEELKEPVSKKKNVEDDTYFNSPKSGKYVFEDTNADIVLEKLANELDRLGANGIINFKIGQSVVYYKDINVCVTKINVTGMAIKK